MEVIDLAREWIDTVIDDRFRLSPIKKGALYIYANSDNYHTEDRVVVSSSNGFLTISVLVVEFVVYEDELTSPGGMPEMDLNLDARHAFEIGNPGVDVEKEFKDCLTRVLDDIGHNFPVTR